MKIAHFQTQSWCEFFVIVWNEHTKKEIELFTIRPKNCVCFSLFSSETFNIKKEESSMIGIYGVVVFNDNEY